MRVTAFITKPRVFRRTARLDVSAEIPLAHDRLTKNENRKETSRAPSPPLLSGPRKDPEDFMSFHRARRGFPT
jgi:hypothetical protein